MVQFPNSGEDENKIEQRDKIIPIRHMIVL